MWFTVRRWASLCRSGRGFLLFSLKWIQAEQNIRFVASSYFQNCPVVGARSSWFLPYVCSAYQVVVEEERPRRARGAAEILRCYPVPIHFQNATLLNSQYYFTAQFPAAGIHSPQPFTVGDNKTYNGYWNAPLLPQKSYSIYYQAVSSANGVGVSDFLLFSSLKLKLCRVSFFLILL